MEAARKADEKRKADNEEVKDDIIIPEDDSRGRNHVYIGTRGKEHVYESIDEITKIRKGLAKDQIYFSSNTLEKIVRMPRDPMFSGL